MNLQGMNAGQQNPAQMQSDTKGNGNQKIKDNTVATNSVGGNKVAIHMKERTKDEEEKKELDKILRRPRSRKYMKAIKLLDSLSEGDEMIIAELKKEAGADETDDLVFTPEDIEAFKQRMQDIIQEEIRKEEEKRRIEEEKRRIAEDKLQDTMAPCCIQGCQVHSLSPSGNIIDHYPSQAVDRMDYKHRFARDLVIKYGGTANFSFVEIYKYRLAHRNNGGDIIKIYHIDDEGNIE